MNQLLVILFCSAISFSVYANQGLFMVVKGEVKVMSASQSAVSAKVGTKVNVGDVIETGTDSRAKIVMVDRNVINLSPNTKMKIEEYSSEAKSKNVKLSLLEGKIRNNVEQKYDNDKNKFEVRTPTAVAGVRGTQFITSYSPQTKATEVITLHGQVEFRMLAAQTNTGSQGNNDGSAPAVIVSQGEKSSANSEAAAPEPPVKVPKNQLREIERDSNVRQREEGNRRSEQRPPPPPPPPTANLNDTKPPIVEGTIQNQFEKTKVKVEPKPPTGP